MRIKYLLLIFFLIFAQNLISQVQQVSFSVEPPFFDENEPITITVSDIDPGIWNVDTLYLWAWSYDENDKNPMDAPGNGSWNHSGDKHKMTANIDGTFAFTLVPTDFFARTGIGRFGMLVKARDGSGDKKTQDFLVEVGGFQLHLDSPENSLTILDSAQEIVIHASSSLQSTFTLQANGDTVFVGKDADTIFEFKYFIKENTHFVLEADNGETKKIVRFSVVIKPEVEIAPLPAGLKDGINRHADDSTAVTLVFFAPGKKWVHVIGSFNGWQINDNYLMKKDTVRDRFWITLSGLNSQGNHLYQYLVDFSINVADPYSTLILDPYSDPFIDTTLWLDLPKYPADKTTESVTWLRSSSFEYEWQNSGFVPPEREDLVIYELLIRDFDKRHSFDAVRERLDYIQSLGVNAIELMPVTEFDGNDSWGYNPSFHMAIDKYYGSPEDLKQLVDECHTRGIAVILDVVYNHATGQNPYMRLWNDCGSCLRGKATSDNPFFNTMPTHAYNVFNDFNHQSQATRTYVKRTIEYLIGEFRIDGFRWDLTKGFTQNCGGPNQENCTNSYQADRVEVLKSYADIQWARNPEFYVIFEHLGVGTSADEEEEWAQYRRDEGLGIMFWNNMNYQYSEAAMGYHDHGKSNFSAVYGPNKDLPVSSAISYMESHDQERIAFKMLEYGNSSGNYQVQSLSSALDRLKLAGAFFFTVPGPKMIWQFGELGYDISIDQNGRTGSKPILWEYADDPERKKVYKAFQALIELRQSHEAFTSTESQVTTDLNDKYKVILIDHSDMDAVIAGNFGVTTDSGQIHFPLPGKWYTYFSGDSMTLADPDTSIALAPGQFHIYTTRQFKKPEGNILTAAEDHLAEESHGREIDVRIYPNPFRNVVRFTFRLSKKSNILLELYDMTGKKMATVSKGIFLPGECSIDFHSNSLPPGIYWYRLQTDLQSVAGKLVHP